MACKYFKIWRQGTNRLQLKISFENGHKIQKEDGTVGVKT
jgi:hypothetical protein